MLTKRDRMTRDEIASLGNTKVSKTHTDHLTLVACSRERSKWGVVVSKKVARRAVDRTLLRRRLYALVHEWGSPYPHPHHHLLVTKKGAAERSFQELREELRELWGKVRKS